MEEKHRTTDHPEEVLRPLSMVILTHPKPSVSPAHAHLPTLVHLSALFPPSATSETGTRLVSVQTSSEARLASSLHIPRVGALAIYEGAPGAKVLEEYVREHIGPTECKWIDEAMSAEWKGLNVKSEIPGSK
jgi:ribonuclease P/MRP protein subunit POP3